MPSLPPTAPLCPHSDGARLAADLVKLVDENLLPSSVSAQARLAYHRLKGDFHRYVAECSSGV